MKQNMVIEREQVSMQNWRENANPRRGKESLNTAIAFIQAFPVGSEISSEQFDDWAQKQGLLNVPPSTAPKDSDAWKAHIQRRHELRHRIGNAGSTPGMRHDAFSIDTMTLGRWIIRPPHLSFSQNEATRKVHSLAKTQKRKLRYLMESADWTILPAYQQALAEEIFFDIEHMEEDIGITHNRIGVKVQRLESKIRKALEAGEIEPVNHGIQNLLAPLTEDS